jgi:hypothetical protein
MKEWIRIAVTLAAGGTIAALAEALLPHTEIRKAAKTAIGIAFLELLATEIAGIIF